MARISGNNAVLKLIGLTLTSVNVFTDFTRLLFEGGWELIIYNPFTVEVSGVCISSDDESLLIGKTVITTATTTSDEFFLQLSGETNLRVDLRDEVFVGPEAMQLIGPAGEIVVWN